MARSLDCRLADSFFLMSSRSGILISSPSSGPSCNKKLSDISVTKQEDAGSTKLADSQVPTPGALTELHRAQDHGLPARKEAEPKPMATGRQDKNNLG